MYCCQPLIGWGGRIRTFGTQDQNLLPYRLATPQNLAEAVGFEPTVRCRTLVFKTSAFDHSATLPIYGRSTRIRTLDLCIPNAAHYQTVLYSVIWHRCRESNPGFQFWRLTCYRNTSPTKKPLNKLMLRGVS
jgi:hypothetical protein